ncbi:MAG: hypothetical protein Q8J97_10340, partial [Flavobacteriaceae bacterium]|nr:hypothetical protein [Flavobacteriaceae bacterium]
MTAYRRHAKLAYDVAIIFLVDEIGYLGEGDAIELASALMGAQDDAIKKKTAPVGFIFTAIFNFLKNVKNKLTTFSNREVDFLPLQPLPVDTWHRIKPIQRFITSSRQAYHLALLCAGHPRAMFDGLPVVAKLYPSVVDVDNFTRARKLIVKKLKPRHFDSTFLEETLREWIKCTKVNRRVSLVTVVDGISRAKIEGLVIVDAKKTMFSMLLSILWSHLVSDDLGSPLLRALDGYYIVDSQLTSGTEVHFELVMVRYEILQRLAWAEHAPSPTVKLGSLFMTEHVDPAWKGRKVIIPECPVQPDVRVDSLADVDEVIRLLRRGHIVISNKRTELGIEYLSPFFDASDPTKLVVAAIQCKFQPKVDWGAANKKWADAVAPFQVKGVECFAVIYTSS